MAIIGKHSFVSATRTDTFIPGINNPHLEYEPSESDLVLCPALPSHPLLAMSEPHNIKYGYMWACRVEDWAAVAPEVPPLPDMSLLE